MKRWSLWQASLALFVSFSPIPDRAAEVAGRPNIVFLLADQWRGQALGCAKDPNARTPHLDRLASQGVMLVTAVSNCPVCSPFRASLMTGRYPISHGVFVNDVCLNREAVSLAQAFGAAGYRTGYIGKWHLDGHGRSSFIPKERRQGFEFWRANECTHDYNHSPYYADSNEKRYWKGYDAEAETNEALAFIRAQRQHPFVLVLSWGPPHNPYETAPERFRSLFKKADIQLRPNVPLKARAAALRDLAGYYAHCAALDECAGRIMDALEECKLAENTILVMTADHGDMLGSHAEIRKQRPWDESILVPLLVRWPGGLGQSGRKLSAPFGSPDIMPTLLGLCGIKVPGTVEGENRAAWLRGEEADGDRAELICCITPFGEWTRDKGGREFRGLRTTRYTYVRSLDGPWLLYDNQDDRYQQYNLIGDAKHAALQSDLDGRLKQVLKLHKDEFRPGREYLQKWGYRTDAAGTVPYTP